MNYRIKIVKEPKKEDILPVHYSLSLVVVGDSGVGKTSLLMKLTKKDVNTDIQTVGLDFFSVTLPLLIPYEETKEDPRIHIQITDTSGQERFKAFVMDSLKKSPVVIIMYDCQNEETFGDEGSKILEYYEQIRKKNEWAHVMIVLIAGKADELANVKIPHVYASEFAQTRYFIRFHDLNVRGWLFMKVSSGDTVYEVEDKFSRIATAALERLWGEENTDELWAPFVDAPYVTYKYISE